MFRIISMVGLSSRKLSMYSQASVTKYFLPPIITLLCSSLSMPPTSMVGSRPALCIIRETMDVVVVFPWVPETAMDTGYSFISTPRASALEITGTPSSLALSISGFSMDTALE